MGDDARGTKLYLSPTMAWAAVTKFGSAKPLRLQKMLPTTNSSMLQRKLVSKTFCFHHAWGGSKEKTRNHKSLIAGNFLWQTTLSLLYPGTTIPTCPGSTEQIWHHKGPICIKQEVVFWYTNLSLHLSASSIPGWEYGRLKGLMIGVLGLKFQQHRFSDVVGI